jgi:hypothetical protein
MAKPLWTTNVHFNYEGQECKTGPVKAKVSLVGRERGNGDGKGGWI